MTTPIFYIRNADGLTLYVKGKHEVVSSTHPNFNKILVALKDKAYELVLQLMNVGRAITAQGSASKRFADRKIFVENGKVFWTDSSKKVRELHGTLVDRILEDMGKPNAERFADALLALLDNIMKNKKAEMRKELYEFLMSGKAPITYDGCILAYKKVRADFKDIYTGTMDNSPGKIVSMPQDEVDTNRDRTCSHGLHFATLGYLSHYGSTYDARVVIVKVNPRHIFAIPTDYSFQKGRCSQYEVVGEHKGDWQHGEEVFEGSFIDEDSKVQVAPKVEFVPGSLRVSLETLGENFGIIVDGKVAMIGSTPVREANGSYFDIIGTPVDGVAVTKSFATKSVREAVKAAVAKAQS